MIPLINCCIDVGLRNLAFCIMNDKYEILLLNVFNVLNDNDYFCKNFLKNGKICNKKCTMKYSENNNNTSTIVYTCKTHFPKNITITKHNSYKKKNINNYLLQDIAIQFINTIQSIFNENRIIFDLINNFYIELQPKCNAKMKFISHILYGKLIDLYLHKNVSIRYVKASLKLKVYKGPPIECLLKNKYSQRKWLSIEYCKWFFEHLFSEDQKQKWLPFFLSFKKADDLADVILMNLNVINGLNTKQLTHKNGNSLK